MLDISINVGMALTHWAQARAAGFDADTQACRADLHTALEALDTAPGNLNGNALQGAIVALAAVLRQVRAGQTEDAARAVRAAECTLFDAWTEWNAARWDRHDAARATRYLKAA